jgi:hypothetical protein
LLDDQSVPSEDNDLGDDFVFERRPRLKRKRVVFVFDEAYSAHGMAVYSAVHLLIHQLGSSVSYDVFCLDAYRGPKFAGAARVSAPPTARWVAGAVARLAQSLHRSMVSFHMTESPGRWESNLDQNEKRLLGFLFDADNIHAVIVFTANAGFALRVSRLAHVYSSAETPHLIVVTPNDRLDLHAAADLDWVGVRVLRDGDLVVYPNQVTALGSTESDGKPILSVFSFLSAEDYPRQLTNPHNQIDWLAWIGPTLSYPKRVRDVVLFVRPDWMNCGSGTTFKNLALWFRERDALLIDIGIWPYSENFDPTSRELRVAAEQETIQAALYLAARMSTSVPHVARQIGGLLHRFPWTLARQVSFRHCLAAKPRFLRKAIQRAKISQIYINHYFTYDYAREFIGDRPFFLDTHDIQTVNFIHHNLPNAITGRVDRFEVSLRDEMEIAGKARRLCFVSSEELDIAARYIDRDRLDYVLPLPKLVPCRPKPPATPARLLIVASNNQGNVRSLNWFFTHVWPAVLWVCGQQLPPRLRVCGGIGAILGDVNLRGVEFVGVVPDLRTYYDDCDLVLLPVVTGGGVAIKTLEAVLYERAVLATRHALRGLPDDVVRTIGCEDDPVQFARSLLAIVADPKRHEAQLERSQRAAALLRQHSFYDVLGRAVDSVRFSQHPHPNEISIERAEEIFECAES